MAEKENTKNKNKKQKEEGLAGILSSVFGKDSLLGDPLNFDELDETIEKEKEKEEEQEQEEEKETEAKEEKEEKEEEVEEELFPEEEADENHDGAESAVSDVLDLIVDELEQSGFLEHYEIPEDAEIDFKDLVELIQLEAQEKAAKQIYQFVANLPDDLKLAIQWVLNGKSMTDFVKEYESIVSEKQFTIDNEEDKETFIRWWLINKEQYEPEDVDDFVKSLKDKGKLDKYAKTKYKIYEDEVERKKKELQERALREQEEQQKKLQEQKEIMAELLNNITEIDGLKIEDKEKDRILSALFDMTEEVGNQKVTLFQKKLAEILNDRKKTILLAKLVLNDLNLSSIYAESERKLIRKMAGESTERKRYTPRKRTKTVDEPPSLADALEQLFG